MRNHNLMLKQLIASMNSTVLLHIPDVTKITYLTTIYTTSACNEYIHLTTSIFMDLK